MKFFNILKIIVLGTSEMLLFNNIDLIIKKQGQLKQYNMVYKQILLKLKLLDKSLNII